MRPSSRRLVLIAFTSVALGACGGGGGEGSGDAPLPRVHSEATLAISATNAEHVLAQSYVAFKALHSFVRNFPSLIQFSGASPTKPVAVYPCGTGQIDIQYTDADHDGRVSVGDTFAYVSRACGFPSPFDGGTILQTVTGVDGAGIASSSLAITDNGYDHLFVYGVQPKFTGSFTLYRYQSSGYLLVSVGEATFLTSPSATLSLSNVAIAQVPAPSYGANAAGSMDVTLNTPLVANLRVQVETRGAAISLIEATNEAPLPGQFYVGGANGTQATLFGTPDITSFHVEAGTAGNATSSLSVTLSAEGFFATAL